MKEPGQLSEELEGTVVRCTGAVRSVAGRFGFDDADVDELFQEVRVRLWRALERGEKIGAVPASYVYRTATSAATDMIRRRRSRPVIEESAMKGTSYSTAPSSGGPSVDLARSEVVARVHEAVDALIESRRPVVRMYLAGYALPEIAELLGWTEGKTRNLLYRGLSDVREALAAAGVGPEDLA